MNKAQVVGVADCAWSNDPEGSLVTYALGSCIAVTVHDATACVAGMLHFMLPEPTSDAQKVQKPWMFATTGVPLLFERLFQLGANKKRLIVRLVGGAQLLDESRYFSIGKRNHAAVRKILWKEGILVQAESVGGNESRTARLEVGTGKLWIRHGSRAAEELTSRVKGVGQCRFAS